MPLSKSRIRSRGVPLLVQATLFLFSSSAFSASKNLADLFPLLTDIDTSALYTRDSPQYAELFKCQQSTTPATDCPADGKARFYLLGGSGVDDSFDFANRCIGLSGFKRYAKDIDPANKLDLTTTTVNCPGLKPAEVIAVHLVLCYTRATGASCSFATACFEGSEAKGECTKDYPAEAISGARVRSVTQNPPNTSSPTPCLAGFYFDSATSACVACTAPTIPNATTTVTSLPGSTSPFQCTYEVVSCTTAAFKVSADRLSCEPTTTTMTCGARPAACSNICNICKCNDSLVWPATAADLQNAPTPGVPSWYIFRKRAANGTACAL